MCICVNQQTFFYCDIVQRVGASICYSFSAVMQACNSLSQAPRLVGRKHIIAASSLTIVNRIPVLCVCMYTCKYKEADVLIDLGVDNCQVHRVRSVVGYLYPMHCCSLIYDSAHSSQYDQGF